LHPISPDVNNSNGNKQNLLAEHLSNDNGEGPMEFLKGDKLHQVMDKFTTLCFPNIRNLVTLFKHHLDNKRYIDNILALKFRSVYDYIHDNSFPKKTFAKKCSSLGCPYMEMVVVVVW